MVSEMDKKLYARTLYVSDLDGTLLRSNERTSQLLFTANCNQIKEIKNIFPYEALSSCAA